LHICIVVVLALSSAVAANNKGKGEASWEPTSQACSEPYNRGVDLYNAQRHREAETQARAALAVEPTCGMCAALLGQSLLLQDRPMDALEVLEESSKHHRDRAQVFQMASQAAFASQSFERALAHGERAWELDPDDLHSAENLIMVLGRMGHRDRGAKIIAKLAKLGRGPLADCLHTQLELYLADGQIDNARWANCQAAGPPELVRDLSLAAAQLTGELSHPAMVDDLQRALWTERQAGIDRLAAGDHQVAAEIFEALSAASPDDAALRLNLALCYDALGRHQEAVDTLDRAHKSKEYIQVLSSGHFLGQTSQRGLVEHQDTVRRAFVLHVGLMASLGRVADAQALLDDVAHTLEHPATEDIARAWLLAYEQDAAAAWTALVAAHEAHGDSFNLSLVANRLDVLAPEAAGERGRALLSDESAKLNQFNTAVARFNAGDIEGCLAALWTPDATTPRVGLERDATRLRYNCLVAAGDTDSAMALLSVEADWGHYTPTSRYNHAANYMAAERWASAVLVLRSIDAVDDPSLAMLVRSNLVVAYTRLGQMDHALAAMATGPVHASVRYNIGVELWNAGEHDRARLYLREACDSHDEIEGVSCDFFEEPEE